MKWLIAAAATLAAAVYLTQQQVAPVDSTGAPIDEPPPQETSTLEDITVTLSPDTYTPANVDTNTAAQNERAFLDMLAYSEGTSGPDGYYAMFGYPDPSRICDNLDDHPHQAFPFISNGKKMWTTAAGRYQFMAASPIPTGGRTRVDTWGELKSKLSLPDFSEASQDAAAMELVRQRGALNDVQAGRITAACIKCEHVWASLPGAGYNQSERKIANLLAAYTASGGNLEA